MKTRIIYFFMFFLVIFLINVNAASIVATVAKQDRTVPAGEEATFLITIINNQIREDTFKLEVDDFAVSPFSEVVEKVTFEPPTLVKIPANQKKVVKAKVKFLETAIADKNYITDVKIVSTANKNVMTKVGLSSYVISPREVVDINVNIPEIIIPGRDEILKIKLKNNANIKFENLDIFYTSSIFNAEGNFSLNPLDEREIKLNFNIDPITEQGEYTLTIRLFDEGKIKGSKSFKFNLGLNPDLKEAEETRKGFLINTVEIVRENEGNTKVTKTVKYPISYFKILFTETNPEGELVVEDGQRMYKWVFDIPPGDIYRIEIITDYRIPFFLIVGILIVIGIFVYFGRKDIRIMKSVFKVHETDDEGITELKILLTLTNRTYREMYNIKVIDLLPRFIKPDTDFGTLKPVKIEEGHSGMRMVWELAKFDPGDERVITYKIKFKLPLVGRLELPSAIAQYYGSKKRIVNVRSNRLVYRW